MAALVRRPVRITGTRYHHDRRLVGREATAYSGVGLTGMRLHLTTLLRLSAEASAGHHAGYVRAADVTFEDTAAPTETMLL